MARVSLAADTLRQIRDCRTLDDLLALLRQHEAYVLELQQRPSGTREEILDLTVVNLSFRLRMAEFRKSAGIAEA